MKLALVGFGQAGGNIVDELWALGDRARPIFNGHTQILTDCFAINTDETDLGGLKSIPKDRNHRILLGGMHTYGHGVGKINTDAARIIKASNAAVADSILRSSGFHESDAVIAVSSGGGGTGSGTIGLAVKALKERLSKPIYAIIALPFGFEEEGTTSYAAMNTATCINTVSRYADATILIDNERYRRCGDDFACTFREINQGIASCIYDLCRAGEERDPKHVGSKVIDAGDIKRSLGGFTVIGRGFVSLPAFNFRKNHYRDHVRDKSAILGALSQAEANLGLDINLADARKILVLLRAPKEAIDLSLVEEISQYLQSKAPNAVIRVGDHPTGTDISVMLLVSELVKVERLEKLFSHAEELFQRKQVIQQDNRVKMEMVRGMSRNIPTLD